MRINSPSTNEISKRNEWESWMWYWIFSFRVSFAGRFMGEISHSPSERMIFDVFFTSSPRQIGRNYASTYDGRGNRRGLSKTKNSPPALAHSNTHWIKRVFPHKNVAPTRVPYEINLFHFIKKVALFEQQRRRNTLVKTPVFMNMKTSHDFIPCDLVFSISNCLFICILNLGCLCKVKNDSCFLGKKLATVRNIMKNCIPSFWLNWIARFCVITSVCNSFGSAMHGFRLVIYLLYYKLTVSWKINANKLKQTKQTKKNTYVCVFLRVTNRSMLISLALCVFSGLKALYNRLFESVKWKM